MANHTNWNLFDLLFFDVLGHAARNNSLALTLFHDSARDLTDDCLTTNRWSFDPASWNFANAVLNCASTATFRLMNHATVAINFPIAATIATTAAIGIATAARVLMLAT